MVRVSVRAFAALAATAAIGASACSVLLSFDDLLPQPSASGGDAGDAGDGAPACKVGFDSCDGGAANGCETNITTPENCGACGRTCGGGRCQGGACEAIILANTPAAQAIVVDDPWVYWTNSLGSNDGGIMKVGVEGGDASVVALEAQRPLGLAKDDTHLYWTTSGGNVRRVPKNGGVTEAVGNGSGGSSELTVSNGAVFWTERALIGTGQIRTAPSGGGGPVRVIEETTSASPQGIAADDANVYWATTTDARLHQHSRSGSETSVTIDSLGGTPRHLAIDADHIYWTISESSNVYSALIPFGNSTLTVFAGVKSQTNGIAVDGSYVYWLTDTLVRRVRKTGGPAVTLAALGTSQIGKELTLDDANVYFTITDTVQLGAPPSARIAKTPK